MVAVPPEIGTTRVSLFEASSVPETGRSWVIDTHWFGNSGSKARKVPVTALPLNWSAPVNSAIGVGRVSLFEASSVPETGRSWVIDTHWFGNSGSKARKVPVTA